MKDILQQHFIENMNVSAGICLGIVEAVDDSQEMLRVKVRCPAFGDTPDKPTSDLLWAQVCSPFVGTKNNSSNLLSGGYKLHGLILPPTTGSIAVVAAIDQNNQFLLCLGFLPNFTEAIRTFPQGRFNSVGDGPHDSNGTPIEPMASTLDWLYGPASTSNYERMTRGAEQQISSILDSVDSSIDLDQIETTTLGDGTTFTTKPGYSYSTPKVMGLVTPGGHAIVAIDDERHKRIKIQTASGSQILLDDTNERIYINTGHGNSWFEMDFDGNVDLYCYNYNVHATNNINLTADNLFNIIGKEGVNITSLEHTFITSSKDTQLSSVNTIINSSTNTFIKSSDVNIKSSEMNIASNVNLKGTNFNTSMENVNVTGTNQIIMVGGAIHLNGPGATPASDVTELSSITALWTNRVPEREPWARQSYIDFNKSHNNEYLRFDYNSPEIGKENVENLRGGKRNEFWRR